MIHEGGLANYMEGVAKNNANGLLLRTGSNLYGVRDLCFPTCLD